MVHEFTAYSIPTCYLVLILFTQTCGQYHTSDGLPVPQESGGRASAFTSRVLRWHEDYCGKSRLCQELQHLSTSDESDCYKCAPCRCDTQCHIYSDCCADRTLNDWAAASWSREDQVFRDSLACVSSEYQLFLTTLKTASNKPSEHPMIDRNFYGDGDPRDRWYENTLHRDNYNPGVYRERHNHHRNRGRPDYINLDDHIPRYHMISRCPYSSKHVSECEGVGSPLSPVSQRNVNGDPSMTLVAYRM